MRLSQSFTKTRKDVPADEVSKNAQLLIQAGFIHKEMAGVYDFLPLGLRVLRNVEQIVREEMDATGADELIMTTLQRKELWERTDRWSDENVDIWFKTELASGSDVGLGWSHEEPIADMMRGVVDSYRDLPLYVYQFQRKMRNELRAKSGIMRGREFIMKDLYSFTRNEEEHQAYYDAVTAAYHRVFDRLGIGDITYFTFASGGAFTQFSHEFQTICDAGEDTIFVDKEKKLAINKEVYSDDVLSQLGLNKENLVEETAAEVGNIFSFGTSKSEQLDLTFVDDDGTTKHVVLGSYGIGITRVIGVIAELMADDRGLVWPKAIAPADIHMVRIGDSDVVVQTADEIYETLQRKGKTVIYDDRNDRPGQMLADADLIGVPMRMVISEKSLKAGGVEMKARTDKDATIRPTNLEWL